jgi:AraC-like DNA-binding protein
MPDLETAIRLIVIGQDLLIALILMLGRGRRNIRYAGAALLLGVAAYLYMSSRVLGVFDSPFIALVSFFAIAVPYSIWAFARALFEAPMPRRPVVVFFLLIGMASWLVFLGGSLVGASASQVTDVVRHVASLFVVINALWFTVGGRFDDLLEARRRFRIIFVVLVSAQILAVVIAELVLGSTQPPGWVSLLNVIVIGVLTLTLGVPFLQLRPDLFERIGEPSVPAHEFSKAALSAADKVLLDRLTASMAVDFYRTPNLTIRNLAAELNCPEHQLRRVINGHLGFRNFSTFLNGYRIEEAKTMLGQPENAKTPILLIALDLGYGSLGPFNRAFKAATGMTPTAYREQAILGKGADSE